LVEEVAKEATKNRRLAMSLTPPETVQKLQSALHAKAKGFADLSAAETPLVPARFRFVLGWQSLGHQARLEAFIVNYADDLVICCRGSAEEALVAMRQMMSRLKLTVNETKTRVCQSPKQAFDFLGYTFGRMWSYRTGRSYQGVQPAKARIKRLCDKVSAATDRRQTDCAVEEVVGELNPILSGWQNYFSLGSVSRVYRNVDNHVSHRLRMWPNAKHKVYCIGKKRFTDAATLRRLGVFCLQGRKGSLPWAKA
jgi:RNA-directed DNA polymerase